MKYTKEYLEENTELNEQGLALATAGLGLAGGVLGRVIGGAGDVVSTVLRPPLDLARTTGKTVRADQYKRLGKSGFGGTGLGSSSRDAAIRNVLMADYPNLLSRLRQRASGIGGGILSQAAAVRLGMGRGR